MYTRNLLALALLGLISLLSCRQKDDTPNTSLDADNVFVINEGTFGAGNGNLTAYNKSDNSIKATPIEDANGTPLGDVAQSAYTIGDEVWIPINASNKIIIIDPKTFKIKDQITDITTPRYGCVYEGKFYIGNAFGPQFYSIDISSHKVTTLQVPAAGITDMVAHEGKIYMTASASTNKNIYVYDTQLQGITDSLDTGDGYSPQSIERYGDKIYVLSGSAWHGVPYRFTIFSGFGAAESYALAAGEYKDILTHNGQIYMLANDYVGTGGRNGVFRYDPANPTTPQKVIDVPTGVSTFYAMGIDPVTSEIYLSDAKSYTVDGDVYRYTESGALVAKFEAGLIPSFFLFR